MGIFRYPGGKSRLLKALRPHLDEAAKGSTAFHDVFVGGGSVLFDVAERYPSIQLCANDMDEWVHAFYTVLVGQSSEQDAFLGLIDQSPTIELFRKLRATEPSGLVEKAYYAVFFNRTTFSGIFRSGPIGGYEQKSKWKVGCRYNREKIASDFLRLRDLVKDRLTVHSIDAIEYLRRFGNDADAFYMDPPYYEKGSQLYRHSMGHDAHVALAQEVRKLKRWVVSYDYHQAVKALYGWANCVDLKARYSITGEGRKGWEGKSELVIVPSSSIVSHHTGCIATKE